MNKIISLLLCTFIISASFTAFAENEKTPIIDTHKSETAETATVSVTATIADTPFMKTSDVVFEISSLDGQVLDKESQSLTYDTKSLVFTFDVPKFEIGTSFKVRATD